MKTWKYVTDEEKDIKVSIENWPIHIYPILGKDSQKSIGKLILKVIVKSLVLAIILSGHILEDYIKWLIHKLKLWAMEGLFTVRDLCMREEYGQQ